MKTTFTAVSKKIAGGLQVESNAQSLKLLWMNQNH